MMTKDDKQKKTEVFEYLDVLARLGLSPIEALWKVAITFGLSAKTALEWIREWASHQK